MNAVLKDTADYIHSAYSNHVVLTSTPATRTDLNKEEMNTVHIMLKQLRCFRASLDVDDSTSIVLMKIHNAIMSVLRLDVNSTKFPYINCPICSGALLAEQIPRTSSKDSGAVSAERSFEFIEALPCNNCQISIDVCCYTYTTIPFIDDTQGKDNILKCPACSSIARLPIRYLADDVSVTTSSSFDWAFDFVHNSCLKCPYCHIVMSPFLF